MEQIDKIAVALEAKTEQFKKGLERAGQYAKAFAKGVKLAFKEEVAKSLETFKEDINFNDKDYSKRIEYIQDKMDAVMDQINAIKEGGQKGNLDDLEAEYDRLAKKLEYFTNRQAELNDEMEETNMVAKKTGMSLQGLFDNSIGKIKRFTYYLLGARSVFSLFMKYRSIYYQYNEEMQYQTELSQNAIALSLAPAFKILGDVIAYASIAFAKFIELLTGVPILAKVSTKGIRDYNKSLKETQTLVSGIDEITNLTNPQNLGLASQYQALADFQEKIKEVEEFFANNQWITDLAEGLKVIWKYISEKLIPKATDFIKKIGGIEGAIKLLGGAVVMGAIAKVIGTAGAGAVAGTGLAGIAGLLTFIAGVHVITLVLEGEEEFNKLKGDRNDIASNYKSWYDEMIPHITNLINDTGKLNRNSKEYKDQVKKINEAWKIITREIQAGNTEILNDTSQAEELAKILDNITNSDSYTKSFEVSKAIGLDQANDLSKTFWQKWAGWFVGQDSVDAKRRQKYMDEFNGYEQEIDEIAEGLDDLNEIEIDDKNAKIKYDVSADTKSADNKLSSLFKKFNVGDLLKTAGSLITSGAGSIIKSIGNAISGLFTPHATGLDYVPYDNYPALLHKGEAVVPAKYNPTIHSQGNEYTNRLLETMIMKMDDYSNRPIEVDIDGKKFVNATYGLYDSERKRQGYVEGVIR